MDLGTYPKLTKSYILERVPQEKLMEYYLKIPVIPKNFEAGAFSNPFRKDNIPSCNYFYGTKDHKLRYRDFGGDFSERLYNSDVFDIVGRINKIDPESKQGFITIINIIARDFKLHKYQDGNEIILFDKFLANQVKVNTKVKVIKIVPRRWNKADELYWYGKYGIGSNLLKEAKVLPAEEVWIEDKTGHLYRYYKYKVGDLAYAYYGGKEASMIDLWKIYFPDRRSVSFPKVITNKPFVQGFDMFQPCRIGVITKSLKDVLVFKTMGISAITLSSESQCLTDDQAFRFKTLCDFGITVLDWDRAGLLMARLLRDRYNFRPQMLSKHKYGNIKDISDFREAYGRQKTIDLINMCIDHLWEEREYSNRLNTNQLVW